MPILELPSGTLHYDVQGTGDALLLIPGFASGAWSWTWQVTDLAKSFTVVTFDPIGIGRSKINDGEVVTIAGIAGDIGALIEKLGFGSVHILGISFGGFVAQEFVVRYPERVKRLILGSTSFGGPNHVAPAMPVLATFVSTDGLNTAERIRNYMTVAFTPEFVRTHPETVDRFCQLRQDNFVSRDVYMQQLQAALNFDLEKDVTAIGNETLVITGEDDIVVPPQNSRNLAATIPNTRLEVMPGCGHMAFVEKSDEFNRIATTFLGTK